MDRTDVRSAKPQSETKLLIRGVGKPESVLEKDRVWI